MTRIATTAVTIVGLALATAGCSAQTEEGGGDGEQVTITLAGPNQFNSDPATFGPAWEELIAAFEKAEPNIEVETTVLPLSEFKNTLSTQLAAGTAPELIFAQTAHTPEQVVTLDEYLEQPNPYVEGNERWLDLFDADYFGPNSSVSRNAANHYEFVPFNLYIFGLYYNADVFDDAGVSVPETYGELLETCDGLREAGYTPLAFDNTWLAQNSVFKPIMASLLSKYYDDWNRYGGDGEPGQATQVSQKSFANLMLTAEITPQSVPEVGEALELAKEVVDRCATDNWSGVASTGTTFTGAQEFLSGKAGLSFGANFSADSLADVEWEYGTLPFPTITRRDTPLATGEASRLGATVGGTSYMIPAYIEGAKLDAAIKFLQFVSSPEHVQPWLDGSGGIPALTDAAPAPGLEGFLDGEWAVPPLVPDPQFIPKAVTGQAIYTGYFTGSKSLDAQLDELAGYWIEKSKELAADGGWTEDWATG
jgi:multiple sugar transport system substrate-binding protein